MVWASGVDAFNIASRISPRSYYYIYSRLTEGGLAYELVRPNSTNKDLNDQQRDGITAPESLVETKIGGYVAYLPSLDAAHRVGSVVVHKLVRDWKRYRDDLPRP